MSIGARHVTHRVAAWACVLVLSSFVEGEAMTFFVSTRGNDQWSGTLADPNPDGTDGPFRTLPRARDAVRQAPKSDARHVVIRAGTYYLDEPLVLGPEDSGSERNPVVYSGYPGEDVIVSGGRKLTGWSPKGDRLWRAPVPDARDGEWEFRQLRVDDEMQTLARYPNADPADPLKTGWLFASDSADGLAAWRTTMSNIHTPGDRIAWDVQVPRDGEYALWMYYGQLMKPHGRTDMNAQTAFQIDGGPDIPLMNLPDTGNWSAFKWSRVATLDLSAGRHRLTWINRKGGGINFNAFALCSDPRWTPEGIDLKNPGEGHALIVQQAQDYAEAKGKEMRTSRSSYRGKRDEIPYAPGDIPEGSVEGGQVLVFPAWGWVGGPVQIAGIDRQEHVLKLKGPNASQDIRIGNRYTIQNVPWALDQPGEFYLDREAGELLYMPDRDNLDGCEVVAPFLDRLIECVGDAENDRWAEYIRFEELAFRDARYSIAVDSMYSPDDAAIHLRHARHITVDRCRFSHLGGYAVHLSEKSRHCRILRCDISDMGQGGVITRGDNASQPTDCEVAGCRIRNLGRVYKHVAGVYVTTGSRIRVAHNTIHEVPRYAISFKSFNAESASHECVAEYNDIRRTNLETNDTGAIETLGRDRKPTGNIIRYNLILDTIGMKHTPEGNLLSPYYTWGIYLDDYSSGTLVTGNVVARNFRGGYHNHLGFDNVVENNIFIDGRNQQAEWNGREHMRRNTFVRNIVVFSNPEAQYLSSNGWNPDVLEACDYNCIWWTGGDLAETERKMTPAGTWTQWRELGFDTHSVLGDPLFVDAANDDYRLREASPALELGFKPIPMERIGADGYQP